MKTPKKEEGIYDSLPIKTALLLLSLEVEADRKLQLPHGRAALEAGNLSVVAVWAINATVSPIVRAESVHGVIEHVEGIRAELCGEPLRDPELLHRRQVGVEARWPVEGVTANVAYSTASRRGERSRGRSGQRAGIGSNG